MRDLHARMLEALLEGDGLRSVAELAAAEAQSPIAIVIPSHGMTATSDDAIDLGPITSEVAKAVSGQRTGAIPGVEVEVPVERGDKRLGSALAFAPSPNGAAHLEIDREEILRAAALASLTVLAVADARDEVAGELRGSLLEDLRSGRAEPHDIARRAARMGCDLSLGAVAVVAEVPPSRPRHAVALVTGEWDEALAEPFPSGEDGSGTRLYALLPARAGGSVAATTLAGAGRIASRLRSLGPAAVSSFCEDIAELGRAVAEAELMLDVIGRDERLASHLGGGAGDGVYRLLFRAMASDPEEVRRFFADTVEPLVDHDREYRTDLLGTLESYLANDCNMNATARSVYAHRHTVAHRLNRIRELSGLDPAAGEDRERLGLGIKAYRIIEPTLRR